MEFSSAPFQSNEADELDGGTLTVLEAARRAGVTQSAIIRWIRNGYLSATPSSSGWQIPAHMLDEAARAADEARGTGPVPRRTRPTLAPTPTPIRSALETRAVTSTVQPADIGEHIVAPLAELIRDQIDVVHDQAEVIGWLQAERARLTDELSNLKALADSSIPDTADENREPVFPRDQDLYDEVLSLLWKDEGDEDDACATLADHTPEGSSAVETEPASAEPFEEEQAPANPEPAAWPFNPPDADRSGVVRESPGLRLEDYADPSWFFGNQFPSESTDERASGLRPVPALRPIVSRGRAGTRDDAGSREDQTLHRMIDETERKIAELWRNEEELRKTPRPAITTGDRSGGGHRRHGTMWNRLWPLRR